MRRWTREEIGLIAVLREARVTWKAIAQLLAERRRRPVTATAAYEAWRYFWRRQVAR